MVPYRHLSSVTFLAGLLIVLTGGSHLSAPLAQERGYDQRGYDGGHNRGGGRREGGRRRGGGNVGGLIMQFAPAIIDGLNDYERAQRRRRERTYDDDRPRRERRRRPNVTRDDEPRRTRRRAPRVTVIPPLPPIPPGRFVPPPATRTPPMPPSRAAAVAERADFIPDEVVVFVDAPDPDTIATNIAQGFNLVLRQTMTFSLLETGRIYRFGIEDGRAPETVVAAITNTPGVDFVTPNYYYYLEGEAGGAALDLQYALPKLRVPDAQRMASGQGMSVAVIDSGVDVEHPVLKNADLSLIDVVEDGVEGPDMHGTAVAGIIAASDDMQGIAPAAKIIAVRAFAPPKLGSPPLTTATTLARAVDEAFSNGARIFNMSFAGRNREPVLTKMIDAAFGKGALFVAAAGNEGPDAPPAWPAAHDKVIAITATDEADELYGQANRGGYVFAAAPGVDILAPVTGQGFDYLSGTSFAAAHVTGIIALLMERNPALTADTVRDALVDAAHDLGEKGQDVEFGAGLTDAYGALMLVSKK